MVGLRVPGMVNVGRYHRPMDPMGTLGGSPGHSASFASFARSGGNTTEGRGCRHRLDIYKS